MALLEWFFYTTCLHIVLERRLVVSANAEGSWHAGYIGSRAGTIMAGASILKITVLAHLRQCLRLPACLEAPWTRAST